MRNTEGKYETSTYAKHNGAGASPSVNVDRLASPLVKVITLPQWKNRTVFTFEGWQAACSVQARLNLAFDRHTELNLARKAAIQQ